MAAAAARACAVARSDASSMAACCPLTPAPMPAAADEAEQAEVEAAAEAEVEAAAEAAVCLVAAGGARGGGVCLIPVIAEMSMNCSCCAGWPGGAKSACSSFLAAWRFSCSAWMAMAFSSFRFIWALVPCASRVCVSARSRSISCFICCGSASNFASFLWSRSFLIFLASFFFSSLRHWSTPLILSLSFPIAPRRSRCGAERAWRRRGAGAAAGSGPADDRERSKRIQ